MSLFKKVFFVIILYIFLHNPVLRIWGDLGTIKFLYIILFGVLVFCQAEFQQIRRIFQKEHRLILILLFFSIIRFLGGGEFDYVRVYAVSYFEVFLLPISILIIAGKLFHDFNFSRLVSFLLIVASLGAIISCSCIAFPQFNMFLRSSIFGVLEGDALFDATYRGFGISEGLTYSYGIVQSILLIIGIIYLKQNRWFAPFVILVLISCAINARTSLLIAAVGIILYCFINRNFTSFFTIALLVIFISYAFLPLLASLGTDDQTMVWLEMFADELSTAINTKSLSSSNTGAALFGDMVFFPDNIVDWIIGTGVNVYYTKPHNSDVGWIIQINYGGLIYITLLYAYVITMFMRLRTCKVPVITLFFIAVFLIANTKGPLIPNSGGWRLFVLLYYGIVLQSCGVDISNIRNNN